MTEKLTPFETFRELKARQQATARARTQEAGGGAQAALGEIMSVVEDTDRLVSRLQGGLKHELARELARGDARGLDGMRDLVRRYERLSWELHGQLRAVLEGARKGR
jgi:hypothetical protein